MADKDPEFLIHKSEILINGEVYDLKKLAKLYNICNKFIAKNKIYCPETIYQTDIVVENSAEFVEKICDIVGYLEEDDVE